MVFTQDEFGCILRMSLVRLVKFQYSPVMRAHYQDQETGLAIWRGIHLLSPGSDYFMPGIILKVLWDVLRRPYA
jgi:hypothetical protein